MSNNNSSTAEQQQQSAAEQQQQSAAAQQQQSEADHLLRTVVESIQNEVQHSAKTHTYSYLTFKESFKMFFPMLNIFHLNPFTTAGRKNRYNFRIF